MAHTAKTEEVPRPVLIVDDEDESRELARRLVERSGVRNPVVVAASAKEAIHYLQTCCEPGQVKPALILLDITMPDENGFEVLRWVRGIAPLAGVKVAMLTSSLDQNDQRRSAELGADAYLVKFPSPAVLGCMIRTATGLGGEATR